jgi:uncharacterized phage-associated protein
MNKDEVCVPDARVVANYMLAHRRGRILLTNLSIQKLVFFSHGICLAAQGRALVRNEFEAWDHGPVVPALYDAFKSSRASPISRPAVWYDWEGDRFVEVPSELRAADAAIVEVVVEVYGHLSGLALSDLTHEIGTPWYAVRYPPQGTLFLNNRIPDELIRHYFATTSREIHRRALTKARSALI